MRMDWELLTALVRKMQEGWRYTQSTVTINEASRSLRWLLPPRERRGGIAPQDYLGGSFFTMRPACMRPGQLRHRRSGLGDPLDQFRVRAVRGVVRWSTVRMLEVRLIPVVGWKFVCAKVGATPRPQGARTEHSRSCVTDE